MLSEQVIKTREAIMSNCSKYLLLTEVRNEKSPLVEQGEGQRCEPGAKTPKCLVSFVKT